MTTLSLFPARIRFTNADGTLTPEAYRALQVLFQRVGGPLGDNGVDVFGDLTGAGSAQDLLGSEVVAQLDMGGPVHETLMQQPGQEAQMLADLMQMMVCESVQPDVVQPASAPPAVASGGAVVATASSNVAPYGYTTAAQADGIVTLLNNIRTALISVGIMK